MNQHRIVSKTPLFNEKGGIKDPGYCTNNLYEYNRKDIKANPFRIKEWDFYQFSNERYTVQMTVADISMGSGANFAIFDRTNGNKVEAMRISLLTLGRTGLSSKASDPNILKISKKNFEFRICTSKKKRCFSLDAKGSHGEKICVRLEAEIPKGLESLTMAVPFSDDYHFYLNEKINSMPVKGFVEAGDIRTEFLPDRHFCILDWGRGVWPYKCCWYWGNGNHVTDSGDVFGFEIGWGFGDMSNASENMIFFNGKAHKIGEITLQKEDYMKPWHFTSDDGRFNFTMIPEYDNYSSSRVLGLIGNRCHQVFGKWYGTAVLDDGTKVEINNMTAFCEFSDNRW